MSSVLAALSNSHRALSVSGPALSGLADRGIGKLVPLKLSGIEGVNRLFEYRLTLQTPDALSLSLDLESNFDFSGWIGKELTCKIELEGNGSFVAGAVGLSGVANVGAGTREITGLVTDARFIGLESRHALYEITLRPWLHLATLTSDCKVFQNLSPVEVIGQVLSEYAYPLDKRLIEDYPWRFEMTGNAKMLEMYASTGDQGRQYTHPWELNLYRQMPQMRGVPESGLFIFNDKAGQRYWMAVSFWTRDRVAGEADLSGVWAAFEKVFPGRTPEDNAYAPSEADMAIVELHVSDDLKELNVYLVKGDQRIELPADDIQMFKLAPWANNPGGKTPSPEVIKRQQLGPDAS